MREVLHSLHTAPVTGRDRQHWQNWQLLLFCGKRCVIVAIMGRQVGRLSKVSKTTDKMMKNAGNEEMW